MLIKRNFNLYSLAKFTGFHIVWLTLYSTFAVFLYDKLGLTILGIPWLPISLIGTAVAFYVGFKNNASYERMWEARKIWGSIVNDSRSFAIACKNLIGPFNERDEVIQKLLYRHIGWLYSLRGQLLKPTPWEHINANIFIRTMVARRIKDYGTGLYDIETHEEMLKRLLDDKEYEDIHQVSNMATHILDWQAKTLNELNEEGKLNDFRHMNMQKLLYAFYDHQGKSERIKNYPFPRQYASMGLYFVTIFILLLPFGLIPEFSGLVSHSVWWSIPFSVLVSWVFLMMELIGDYSENPFEGMANDVPMLSIIRNIEIDLREMLGEKNIPPKISMKKNILM